jgi:hypothetical protein
VENNNDILDELKTQTSLLRAMTIRALKDVVQEELKSVRDKKIFELSDGQRTTREIAKLAGGSFQAVAEKWKRWAALGLVIESESRKGRYKRIVSF